MHNSLLLSTDEAWKPCTWWLSWLAMESLWSTLAGPFVSLLAQMGIEAMHMAAV